MVKLITGSRILGRCGINISNKLIMQTFPKVKGNPLCLIPNRKFIDLAKIKDDLFDIPSPMSGHLYTPLTFEQSKSLSAPPKECRMLVRDYIDDCLYNPNYGYFSKQAVIYSPEEEVNLKDCKDSIEFLELVAKRYHQIEGDISNVNDIARQVWHTPTELFKPYYGCSIAKYIVSQFLNSGDKILNIYEMGAGNGTLMLNIMDYISVNHPDLYKVTRYKIIEISSKLAERQLDNSLLREVARSHDNVEIINKSIFEWDEKVEEPCYFIALEVLDNFAHDIIRYDIMDRDQPLQGVVLTDRNGKYEEVFQPVSDPLINEYLNTLRELNIPNPLLSNSFLRKLKSRLPFTLNLTSKQFLPTKAYQFTKLLHNQFPNHKLIMSDFFTLPETVEGHTGPVVQTRYQNTMIPCKTYLVQPGWFDIFFPTDFELFKKVYDHTKPVSDKQTVSSQVLHQKEFLKEYGDLQSTTTQSGENPFLDYYENNKMFLS